MINRTSRIFILISLIVMWITVSPTRTALGLAIRDVVLSSSFAQGTNPCSSSYQYSGRLLSLQSPRISGEDVLKVQKCLLSLGYSEVGAADGWYGPNTYQAVKHFQKDKGLTGDGQVGVATWKAMFNVTSSSSSSNSKTVTPAQIRSDLKSLRSILTERDFDDLVEQVQYATDASLCIIEITDWRKAGMIIAQDPDAALACGSALDRIVRILGKYLRVDTDVVGGVPGCNDIYFDKTVKATLSNSVNEIYYCFEVGGKQYVTIRMFDTNDTNPTLDPYIEIYDEGGAFIGSNDDGVGIGNNSFLSLQLPGGGIYVISATRYSGSGNFWLRLEDGKRAAAGDVNRDCVVDDTDGNLIQKSLSKNDSRYDIDLNGKVTTRDWNFFLRSKGVRCQ